MKRPTIAIVGASADPGKYGNIAVRTYVASGYQVFPVHPKEEWIEGLKVYRSVLDIPAELDRVSVYLPPAIGMKVVDEIARKGTKELFLNPGSESEELVSKARSLGLNVIVACSITDVRRLHCFFCGAGLEAGQPPDRFRCLKCGAVFQAETDPEGCVLRLQVSECGAEECCRHRPNARPS